MVTLDRLDAQLTEAAEATASAVKLIKYTPLHYSSNFGSLAKAIASIFYVRRDVYSLRPDLEPLNLRPEWAHPDPLIPWTQEVEPVGTDLRGIALEIRTHLATATDTLQAVIEPIKIANLSPDKNVPRIMVAMSEIEFVRRSLETLEGRI